MLDELAPLGLAACARKLGVSPFELVRTAVQAGAMPSGALTFDDAHVAKLGGNSQQPEAPAKARKGKG